MAKANVMPFYSELSFSGMLFARIVRSPRRSGVLVSVMHPALPEGCVLYTARDVPGTNRITTNGVVTEVFAESAIAYEGQPVGIIAGPTEAAVDAALAGVAVTVTPTRVSGRTVAAVRIVAAGDAEAVYEAAELKVTGVYSSETVETMISETAGAVAVWAKDRLTIHAPTLWASQLKKVVSSVTAVPTAHIDVKKTHTLEGSADTTALWYTPVIAAQAALAAKLSGKTVKLSYTRSEHARYIESLAAVTITHRTAFDRQTGRISAMLVTMSVYTGHANPFAQAIVDRLSLSACGLYTPDAVRIESRAVATPTFPRTAYPSRLGAHTFFAVENHLQHIAEAVGVLPHDLRKRNREPASAFPFHYHLEKLDAVVETAVTMSDFTRKYSAYLLNRRERKHATDSAFPVAVRGIGLATAFSGDGFADCPFVTADTAAHAGGKQRIDVTLEATGTLVVCADAPEGIVRDFWYKFASETLGIGTDSIVFQDGVSDADETHPAVLLSRSGVMTELFQKCIETIRKQREKKPLPIRVSRMASAHAGWDSASFTGMPFYSTAPAAAVIEVELNPHTFRETVRGVWLCVRGTPALQGKRAEAALRGTIRNVLSTLIKDEAVQPEKIAISILQNTGDTHQGGDIGEIAYSVIPAAYTLALSEVLQSPVCALPLDTDYLSRAIDAEMGTDTTEQTAAVQTTAEGADA